jgi:tetratricopeptide (TPR) repeat protein
MARCPNVVLLLVISVALAACGEQTVEPVQVPDTVDGLISQAEALCEQGSHEGDPAKYREAARLLEAGLQAFPESERIYLELGEVNRDSGQFEGDWGELSRWRADDYYEKALAINPDNVEALTSLGETYLWTAFPKRAIEPLRRALAIEPKDHEARLSLGIALFKTDHYDEAETELSTVVEKAGAIDDREAKQHALEYLGRIHMKRRDYDKAEAVLQKSAEDLVEMNRESDTFWGCPYMALGELYQELGEKEKVARYFRRHADVMRYHAPSQLKAAWKSAAAGEVENAREYAKRAQAISDSWLYKVAGKAIDWRARMASNEGGGQGYEAAVEFYNNGGYPEALAALGSLDTASANVLRGYLKLLQQDYKNAERLFDEVLRIDREHLGARIGSGHLFVIRKQYDKAAAELLPAFEATKDQSGIENQLNHRMACLGLGWAYSNQDDPAQAVAYFDRALAMNSNDLLAMLGKANSLVRQQSPEDADRLYRRVLELDSGNKYAMAELGVLAHNQGDDSKAESLFQQALAMDDQAFSCPHEGLGLVYLKQGKTEDAKSHLEKAIEINPEIEFKKFNALARIYMKEGKYDQAENLLRQSITNFPYDPEAKQMLAELDKLRAETP